MKPTPEQIAKLPKWVQEHLKEVERAFRIVNAMRFTPEVKRDVEIPENYKDLRKGWDFVAVATLNWVRVEKACTSSCYHGPGWEKTSRQQPKELFSTKLKALKAARHSIEMECAEMLANLDEQIEAEERTPTV